MKYGKNALWLLALIGVILVSGCGKKEEAGTVGEWESDEIVTAQEETAGPVPNQGDKAKGEKADQEEEKGNPADSEDAGVTTLEFPKETDYTKLYSKVLDDFYALIASGGDGSVTVEGEGGVGEAIRSNEEDDNFAIVGYAIEDFSGDGIPELVIGDAVYGGTIYTMYSCTDGEPHCILESYYRSRYSWLGKNEFFYEGSGGAIYSIFAHYTLSSDGKAFLCQNYYFSHETDETFEEIGFYHNSSGEMDPEVSTRLSSEEEFWHLGEELSGKVQQIELIPFSEYEPCPEDVYEISTETAVNTDAYIEKTDLQEEGTKEETKYVVIDLSTAKETHTEGTTTPLELKIVSEENNGVDDANDWYYSQNLSLPMIGDEWNRFYDEAYEYQWSDNQLEIYEKETGNCLYILEYPTDKWYVNGNNAYLKDGIFYGASVTNGYAQPDTCFMFAYDLNNDALLWRSASQSYNTMNFVVEGDIIICGYGFTDEKDYLYQIDINSGEIIDKIELKKKPDLLVKQDGKLYVHTYSYNYVIEIS